MEAYTYEALPDDSPSIRLVTILPSPDRESPLICTISPVQLPTTTPYTALSYCWGDPKPTDSLTVIPNDASNPTSGQQQRQWSLPIASNLNTALHHIRDPKNPLIIWIDAICINQKDNREKSLQIPLMAQIYSSASQVLAWIGDFGDSGDVAMDAAVTLSDELTKARQVAEGRIDPTSEDATRMDHSKAFAHADEFITLLARPFFRRVWIVQEIGKGGHHSVVQCGDKRITWDQLVEACALSIMLGALVYSPAVSGFVLMIDAARGKDSCDLYERRLGDSDSRSLLSFLCRYRGFDATDPRDKVFALLNLTEDEVTKDERVKGDYEKSMEGVYTDVAVAIMKCGRSLEILRVPHAPESNTGIVSASLKLPSWVPDWSAKCSTMSLDITAFNQTSEFHPTPPVGENDIPFQISDENTRLTVQCVACPIKIRKIGPPVHRTDSSPEKILGLGEFLTRSRTEVEVLLAWEGIAHAQPSHWSEPYPSASVQAQRDHGKGGAETISEAYRRTLLFGREYRAADGSEICDADFRAWSRDKLDWGMRMLHRLGLLRFDFAYRVSFYLGLLFNTIFGGWRKQEIEYTGPDRFSNELAASGVGRRFFITEDGLFGMGPGGLEKDDEIVLIKGVSVPIVVRPVRVSEAGAAIDSWSVIGDCYVHSEKIIYGKVWSEGAKEMLSLV